MATRQRIFGSPLDWPAQDVIAFSSEFDEGLVLAAYAEGVFPMPLHHSGFAQMGWWSPLQRGVLPLASLRVTRSLRKAARHYTTSIDTDFEQVLARCADPRRPHGWIDSDIVEVYTSLHRAGVVHSVEVWDSRRRLVGGLYGVGLGGLFAGESMFHDPSFGRDASKVALLALVDLLDDEHAEARLIDVQWQTPHLASLGVIEIERDEYLAALAEVLTVPQPAWPERGADAGTSRS